ncbi:uncharacterized protein LOC133559491 [Nerophis ophidion]|uniref:uncharacterized protein LOC133559491 n=1 Tax=Nerophis ophidion TaxID=159077 RepID=UPI002ADFCE3D|nr:uncharacterized protein LOC133559491 [Nerophis ophidion]
MSKPRTAATTTAAAAATTAVNTAPPAFAELWRSVSTVGKTQDKTPTCAEELQSPQRRGPGRFFGLNNGDSPGDTEPSQDIIWDSTSPNAGSSRNFRSVEISDIVNRIAPKDVNLRGPRSPLWQWISESAALTPEMPKPRVKKKSVRDNCVDDLMKLARQFDKNMQQNMQQDKEASEQLNSNNNNNTTSPLSRTEEELRALFDSSTQGDSRGLSPNSSRASPTQEGSHPATGPPSSELKPASKRDDFDDDWDDDLLNDPVVLAMAQSSDANQPSEPARVLQVKPIVGTLQRLCPQIKTTKRSTFKLEPNPHFQTSATDAPRSTPQKLHTPEAKPAASKTVFTEITDRRQPRVAADSLKEACDTLWDDWDDDALFYQVCDTAERLSNSQPAQASSSSLQEKPSDGPTKNASTPLPIGKTLPANAASPRTFVRSNSLPEGWNAPGMDRTERLRMSRSLPGSHRGGGSSGSHAEATKRTVTAASKRSVCDAAAKTNKVFVTCQMAGKCCSAAEIERKKQEALARRRQRMHDLQKP